MVKKILLIFAGIVAVSLLIFLILAPHKFYVSLGLADRYEYWEQEKREQWGDSLTVTIRYDHLNERVHYYIELSLNEGAFNREHDNNNINNYNINLLDSKNIQINRFNPHHSSSLTNDGKTIMGISFNGEVYMSKSDFDILDEVSMGYSLKDQ